MSITDWIRQWLGLTNRTNSARTPDAGETRPENEEVDLGNGVTMAASGDGRMDAGGHPGSGRPASDSNQQAVLPRRPPRQQYTIESREQPHPDAAFDHGHLDGANKLDRTPFEAFLGSSVKEEKIREQIAAIDSRIEAAEEEDAEGCTLHLELAKLRVQRERSTSNLDEAEEELQKAREEERNGPGRDPKRGSIFYALLYGVVGSLFVVGDIVIAYEVVAIGLQLDGSGEQLLFAIALGLLAVLLKPVYDRIIERPYWNGSKKRFYWLMGLCVALVFGTLIVLGIFRVEVMGQLQANELGGAGPPPISTQWSSDGVPLDTAAPDATTPNTETVTVPTLSMWGRLAFVLTAVLFAFAGAVCLGIAFQHGRDWFWKRGLASERKKACERLQSLRKGAQEISEKLAATEQELEFVTPHAVLANRVETLRKRQEQLRSNLADARRERLIQLYRNGYKIGEKMVLVREEADQKAAKTGRGKRRAKRRARNTKGEQKSNINSADRPYVALKKAIIRNKLGG